MGLQVGTEHSTTEHSTALPRGTAGSRSTRTAPGVERSSLFALWFKGGRSDLQLPITEKTEQVTNMRKKSSLCFSAN